MIDEALLKAVKAEFNSALKKMKDVAERAQKVTSDDDLAPERIMNLHEEVEALEEGLERIVKKFNMVSGGIMMCGDW